MLPTLRRGDAVLMHSTMRGFEGFSGNVSEVIAVLEEAIGPEGTLIMPTLSMSGSVVEFVQANNVFNVRTTPSQVGLLTEVFRRFLVSSAVSTRLIPPRFGVPIPAGGSKTITWPTAHGPWLTLSPAPRAQWKDPDACLTFFHCAEELIESRMLESPFTSERYVVKCNLELSDDCDNMCCVYIATVQSVRSSDCAESHTATSEDFAAAEEIGFTRRA